MEFKTPGTQALAEALGCGLALDGADRVGSKGGRRGIFLCLTHPHPKYQQSTS